MSTKTEENNPYRLWLVNHTKKELVPIRFHKRKAARNYGISRVRFSREWQHIIVAGPDGELAYTPNTESL